MRSIFVGGGETGALLRAMDWSKTPLGAPQTWPQSLRSALSICIGSRFPIAIYWGPELALLYNDAWSPIPGGKHPWALGRGAREVWPEIWDTIGPLFDQVLTTGEATYSEDSLLLMHRHGYVEECYFNFTFTPIRGEGGHVEGVFNAVVETTFRVISERRSRVLRKLGEQTAAARSVEEACTLAAGSLEAAQLDAPFCIVYLADSASETARLAGCAGLPRNGPATPELVPLTENESTPWPFMDVVRSGEIHVIEDLSERFSSPLPGGPWPEPARSALVAPLVTRGRAQPSGFLVLGASPRRAVDEEYRQFAEQAASHVSTVLSAVTAYAEERKRAQILAELDRAKTVFFSNISHELRTPLTLMLGPAEDLLAGLHGDVPPRQQEQLATVHRNALRLHRLVNELLDFSRIEAGRLQASYEEVDIATFTRELASVFRSTMERAGLHMTIDCRAVEGQVFVDKEMWEKIVLNLLSNAFKFTFEGEVEVSLQAHDERVLLRVRDTGVGISPADVPRLFERFHRVEGTRARTHEGSGIGLALVQELVKLHGGSIEVESALDVGTTFTVEIPKGAEHLPKERIGASRVGSPTALGTSAFVEEARRWLQDTDEAISRPVPPSPTANVPASNRAPSTRRSARILLADDNADMRDYVKRLLEKKWTVDAFADGAAALASARANPPDLVLTDVMMPQLDGFGLVRELRADRRTRAIPLIMLSARAGEEAKVEGLYAGADDYIIKPFSARELLARIETHLELSRLRVAAETERLKLHTLFMNAPAAVCMLKGPEHRFELANSRYLQLIGARDVIGTPIREALPELEGQGYFEHLDEVYRTGEPYFGNEALVIVDRKRAGTLEEMFVSFVCQPSVAQDGSVEGVLVFAIEVTDQVLARRKIEEERRVAQEATTRAETAVRIRDEFLSVASHELRTPLTTLGLQVDSTRRLLREETGDTAQRVRRKIDTVRRSADRLEQLVRGLLDVSRIAAGRLELQPEEVDLAAIAREICERFEDEAERMGSPLNISIDGPISGWWDPMRLDQVLTNLLSNAIKYGQGNAVDVVVGVTSKAARIRVRDRGIGIAPEDHHRIFERFERAVSNRHFGGLGLGLWISRQIIEAMGGRISVDSKPGSGATFTVDLPRTQLESTVSAQP